MTPKVFDPVDVVFLVSWININFRMIDASVAKSFTIQCVISFPCIAINNSIYSDFLLYQRHQRCAGHISNDLGIDPAVALQNAKHWLFPSSAPTAFAFTHQHFTVLKSPKYMNTSPCSQRLSQLRRQMDYLLTLPVQ
jgi:hypothetical protein